MFSDNEILKQCVEEKTKLDDIESLEELYGILKKKIYELNKTFNDVSKDIDSIIIEESICSQTTKI